MVATGLAVEMSFVAIGWQVYAVRSNPLDLGLVGLAMFVPLPLLALPAGHLADRFPRRTILAVATAVDTAVMIGLLAVTRHGAGQTWPFFVLAFGTGVASAVGAPASRAMTPSLVPRSILVRALAFRSVVLQAAVIVGPAIGGLLFALHQELVYAVAATLSFVALAGVLLLHSGKEPAGDSSPDLASVLGGVRLVKSDARPPRGHLTRSLRSPLRRRRRAAPRLRQGRAPRRAGRPRAPARRACGRRDGLGRAR